MSAPSSPPDQADTSLPQTEDAHGAPEPAATEQAASASQPEGSSSSSRSAAGQVTSAEPTKLKPPPVPRHGNANRPASPEPLSIVPNLPAPNWPPRVVADLMTRKIITVGEDEPIGDLEDWMERFRFRHLPVVDSKAKLVGLISLVDFLHARLGTAPENTPAQKLDAQTPAAAIMRRNVVIARLDSPLRDACDVMLREKLACLPVVLDDGTLVGILTTTDLVRLTVALLPSQQ